MAGVRPAGCPALGPLLWCAGVLWGPFLSRSVAGFAWRLPCADGRCRSRRFGASPFRRCVPWFLSMCCSPSPALWPLPFPSPGFAAPCVFAVVPRSCGGFSSPSPVRVLPSPCFFPCSFAAGLPFTLSFPGVLVVGWCSGLGGADCPCWDQTARLTPPATTARRTGEYRMD